MSARYTRQEFEQARLEPGECDHIIRVKGTPAPIWMACDYHEGYIDGYEAAQEGE